MYLHYWLSCINGAFVASSGTWKAAKVDRRPLSRTALSTIHLMLIAASLCQLQCRDKLSCLCQLPATHALFGISIRECTLGSCGSDQMGSAGCGGEGGMQGPPSDLLTFSWLLMEKVTCTIIFGNEQINACGQRGRESTFWFPKNRTPRVGRALFGSWPSTPPYPRQDPSRQLAVWPMLEWTRSFWLFLHLVQTHHHPVLCKQLKEKSKKVGLVY